MTDAIWWFGLGVTLGATLGVVAGYVWGHTVRGEERQVARFAEYADAYNEREPATCCGGGIYEPIDGAVKWDPPAPHYGRTRWDAPKGDA